MALYERTRRSTTELGRSIQDGSTQIYNTRTGCVRVVRWDGSKRTCDPYEIQDRRYSAEQLRKQGYRPFVGKLPALGSSWEV